MHAPLRALAALGLIAVAATTTHAQVVQPRIGQPKANPIVVHPSINTWPGIPASSLNQPVYMPPFYNPALNNPWMHPITITPFTPFNRFNVPPVDPWFNNFNNVNNPFVVNPVLNNPFAVPPLFVNPLVLNPLAPRLINPFPAQAPPPVAATSTPPTMFKQPGTMLVKGPDLQENPWSGTVYHPISGIATLADSSTFYRVPGTGLPTATGTYATGTGLYHNPLGGTFFNPSSGVISRPGSTNWFVPYVW